MFVKWDKNHLVYKIRLKFLTRWYSRNNQAGSSSKKQHCALGNPSSEALNERKAGQPGGKLCNAKDELSQVNVQAEVPHVQADTIVNQGYHKPMIA